MPLHSPIIKLDNHFRSFLNAQIIVLSLRSGSLIVDFDLIYGNNEDPTKVVQAVKALLVKPFQLENQTFKVESLNFSDASFDSSTNPCKIREALYECLATEVCVENATTAICSPNTSDDNRLTIGLAVGIPLFCLLCAVVIVVVCFWVRHQKKRMGRDDSADDESYFHQPFASALPTRGIWDRRSHPGSYLNERLSAVSSDSSSGQIVVRKKHQFDDSYKDSPWNKGKKNEDDDQGRFTWDFLYKTLQIDEDFQIPRPQLDPGYTSDI
uniref:SEA domain-containing protein n=1 Tax=Biomphalaria glabrata TaxID=6526 RepID=A0A2C9KED0_BIOGL